MEIVVGKYKISGTFASSKEAKEIFLTHFPDVTVKDLDNAISKLKFNVNKPDRISEENTNSDKQHAKNSERSAGGKPSGKN